MNPSLPAWYNRCMTNPYRYRRRRINWMAVAVLTLLVLLVFTLIMALFIALTGRHQEPVIPEETPVSTPDPRYLHNYDWERMNGDNQFWVYEDDNYTSEIGIDVSVHNEEIDWEKVKDAGVKFAFVRCGYRGYETGQVHEDVLYHQNMKGASEAGIDLGVYFFSQAKTAEEAEEEARFVLYEMKDYIIRLPVCYDMEEVTDHDRIIDLTTEERTEIARAFCKVIEDAGYIPIVYGSENWLTYKINMADLQDDYPFWLASYHKVSVSTDFPFIFDIWQYNNTGEIPGIDKDTDLNIRFIPKQ